MRKPASEGADYSACLRSHWRKLARRQREDDPPGKIFGAPIEEVRFASDSLLEGAGFERSVPLDTTKVSGPAHVASHGKYKWQEASELQARVGYGSTDVAIVAAAR